MKTQITFGAGSGNFDTLLLFFICFLFSLNSYGQKLLSTIVEGWDKETWVETSKRTYTYDGNGYLILELSQYFSDNGTLTDDNRTDYTNNSDGTVQQSIFKSLNFPSGIRTTYTYNAAKKVLTTEVVIGDYGSKTTNTYDENNYLTKTLGQNYDNISFTFKDIAQTTYVNNPDGTVNQSVQQSWNGTTWVNVERITSTYENSKLSVVLYEEGDGTIWKNNQRTTYVYNNSKMITELSEKWNGTIWENVKSTSYGYDVNGFVNNIQDKYWVAGNWVGFEQSFITNDGNGRQLQIIYQQWNDTSLQWINTNRITFNYGALGVDEHNVEKSFTFYPNPAQDKFTIKTDDQNLGTKYLITDQLGRQFLNGTITNLETVIDVGQFSNGIYFIQLQQNKNETIKLIKQ